MKKKTILLVCMIVLAIAFSCVFTACDGKANINVFGTSKFKVEVESSVQGVPNDIEVTEEYVKSIISVHLKWNDGSITPVALSECEISFDKNFLETKLNIKVKFDNKTGKLSLPFVEPEQEQADDNETGVGVLLIDMATPDMAEDIEKLKSILVVTVFPPSEDENDNGIEIPSDKYVVLECKVSEDGKELEYTIYVPEYDAYTTEGESITLYDNPRLEYEGEDAIERGMTEQEVRAALAENVKLYLKDNDGGKEQVAYTADVEVEEEQGVTITFTTEEHGFTILYVSYRKYADLLVDFDWGKWKKDMTDNDIIAALRVFDHDDFVFNYTTEVERLDDGFVKITMDGETLCEMLYVAYDAEENPMSIGDDTMNN